MKRSLVVLACIVGVFSLWVINGLMTGAVATVGARAHRAKCAANLSAIGRVCLLYCMDHTNDWPTSLQDITEYCDNPKVFVCPATGNKPGALSNVPDWTDYTLLPMVNTIPASVLAYCPPENHEGKGGNVVFADGSIEWFDPQEFRRVIEADRVE